jgi:hypothetical protein
MHWASGGDRVNVTPSNTSCSRAQNVFNNFADHWFHAYQTTLPPHWFKCSFQTHSEAGNLAMRRMNRAVASVARPAQNRSRNLQIAEHRIQTTNRRSNLRHLPTAHLPMISCNSFCKPHRIATGNMTLRILCWRTAWAPLAFLNLSVSRTFSIMSNIITCL